MEIVVSAFGEPQLHRNLLRFASNTGDLKKVWPVIRQQIKDANAEQFASQGASGSGGWQGLAKSTIRAKQSSGFSSDILVRTGVLRASLTGYSSGAFSVIKPFELTVGTRVPYAKFHYTGTSRMPQRKPLELNDKQKQQIVKTIQAHVMGV